MKLRKQNTNNCIKSIPEDIGAKKGKKAKKGKGANGNNLRKFKAHGFCVKKKGRGKKVQF